MHLHNVNLHTMPSVEPPITDGEDAPPIAAPPIADAPPVTAGAAADDAASDEDSLSSEVSRHDTEGALTSEALRRAVDGAFDVDEGADDMNAPGEVEKLLTDDNETPPKERMKRTLFLAKTIGIDVDNDLAPFLEKNGKKSFTITKKMILQEIKRRDPRIKIKNTKNTTNESLMAVLPDLTDARDVTYIRTQYTMIRDNLLKGVTVDTPSVQRKGTDIMRVFLLINMLPDLRLAYSLSQTGSNREMLDAGETHMSKFLQLLVHYFNDPSLEVSTPCQPSLHYSFAEPIACNKGEFELTEMKAKKLISDSRRYLTTMINDWEKSGNGSNQRLDDSDDDLVFDLWGRFVPETCDGDDRANFLRHLPHYWLMVWHLCDEGDLLRFTCAQLRDDHTASSLSAPPSVSRGSGSARKLAQQTLELQKEIAESVKNIGRFVVWIS